MYFGWAAAADGGDGGDAGERRLQDAAAAAFNVRPAPADRSSRCAIW